MIVAGEYIYVPNAPHGVGVDVKLPRGVYSVSYGMRADSGANSAMEVLLTCAGTSVSAMLDMGAGGVSGNTNVELPFDGQVLFTVTSAAGKASWVSFKRVGDY